MTTPDSDKRTARVIEKPGEADQTLRLMANMPVPEGLEDRLKAGLRSAPRMGRVLPWPALMRMRGSWLDNQPMRGLAAAAITCVVVGGSWAVYSHIEPAPVDRMVVMPHVAGPGGFSAAGAMRTPQTLNGPVLKHPQPKAQKPAAETKAEDSAEAAKWPGKAKPETGDKHHVKARSKEQPAAQ